MTAMSMENIPQEKQPARASKEAPAQKTNEPVQPIPAERAMVLARTEAQLYEDQLAVKALKDAIEITGKKEAAEKPKPKFEGELAIPEKSNKSKTESKDKKTESKDKTVGAVEAAALTGAAAASAVERPAPTASKNEISSPKRETGAPAKAAEMPNAFSWLGHGIAYGAARIAGGAIRMPERFLDNVYDLTMHPQKFFSEIGGKFSSSMARPPKGKGAFFGFFHGLKWLFVGEDEKPHGDKKG